nr:hypothetical protein Iba_chr12fCG20220 [Ipomoea batatas]
MQILHVVIPGPSPSSNSQDSSSATAAGLGCISRSGNSAGRRSLPIAFLYSSPKFGITLACSSCQETQASNSKSEIITFFTILRLTGKNMRSRLSGWFFKPFINPKNVLTKSSSFSRETISGLKLLSPENTECRTIGAGLSLGWESSWFDPPSRNQPGHGNRRRTRDSGIGREILVNVWLLLCRYVYNIVRSNPRQKIPLFCCAVIYTAKVGWEFKVEAMEMEMTMSKRASFDLLEIGRMMMKGKMMAKFGWEFKGGSHGNGDDDEIEGIFDLLEIIGEDEEGEDDGYGSLLK